MATTTSRAGEPLRPRPPAETAAARSTPRVGLEYLGLGGVTALSLVLNLVKLSQNGYANIYYSGAVKSMLRSWHAFFFVSADPNNLITVDKPPLGLWLQALSAKVFGFSPLSLLIPEAVLGTLTVVLLYRIVAPRFGQVAGLVGALALAIFPIFVAVSRDNGVDPLLIFLMLAACGAALAAIDSGRLRTLIWCAVLVGLAFNTKSLAALLCVPGIGLGYLVCAPGSLRRRILHLAAAGVVLVAVSLSWVVAVELTPASARPYVGSSSDNSEFDLMLGYNGFGRVGGQQGGPGATTHVILTQPQTLPLVRPAVERGVPVSKALRRELHTHPEIPLPPPAPPRPGRHRLARPLPFGGTRSPLRIFSRSLGDQAGWIVPLALFGLLALVMVVRGRRDRRMPGLLVLGGWFVVELATLDFSAGIVHPYYSSALGPPLAAVAGAAAVGFASLVRSRDARRAALGFALLVLAVIGTLAVQLVLIHREDDPTWWRIPLVLVSIAALIATPLFPRRAQWTVAVAVGALLVAPLVYSFSVWGAPVAGTFPAAGPYAYAGHGGVGATATGERVDRSLIAFLRSHREAQPYALLTQSADQADPLILLGLHATAVGGYNTTDPAMSGSQLADLVAAHRARYLLIAGPYASRGGNAASTAARLVCPEIPGEIWAAGTHGLGSLLVDCSGRAAQLRHPYASARAFIARYHIRYKL
ncbi:MAG TPA: glycosyltransferase family 39 protein [Solirubrobacteraceae bacterium]|jgi:4-amino-4-deoxy-L-arabinose transferase-like glycosyltransferase|nr:glycosyltransferase family 39 protein [Solirubrobacteraceae bacterium]